MANASMEMGDVLLSVRADFPATLNRNKPTPDREQNWPIRGNANRHRSQEGANLFMRGFLRDARGTRLE